MVRLQDLTEPRSENPVAQRRFGFARSEDGSFIIFGLMIFILMLVAGGLGVDFIRYETERARLQATLDRAVLAAANLDQTLDPKEVILDYVARAGMEGAVSRDDITVVASPISRYVTVDVNLEVPTLLLGFVGVDSIGSPAGSAAQQMASQTEISLVLDVSGSMGSDASGTNKSRVEVLQEAAETFVNMVLCDPTDPTKTTNCTIPEGSVAVNIVPYSEQVLVGEGLLDYLNVTNEHAYSSCVHFDSNDYNSTSITATTPLQRAGHFDARNSSSASNWTCKPNSWREITAFEDDISVLQSRIAALDSEGNTSIDIGMKWGAALLDPDFEPVVANMISDGVVSSVYEDYPLSWDTKGVQKVIVLMTDGVNTDEYYLYDNYRSGPSQVWRTDQLIDTGSWSQEYIYSVYRSSTDSYYWPNFDRWEDHPFGAGNGSYQICSWWSCTTVSENAADGTTSATRLDFPDLWAQKPWRWYSNFSWLNSPGSRNGNSTKNARLEDICTAAKNDGMKIFTIGFDTSWSAETILKNCASENSYYFDADGLNLENIFAMIAREVSKLKLVN